jgi:hypothetical protein
MQWSKFNIGDSVIYQGLVYKVRSVHALNWSMNNPFVYGLILAHKSSDGCVSRQVYVCEQQIAEATTQQIQVWELLYGNR